MGGPRAEREGIAASARGWLAGAIPWPFTTKAHFWREQVAHRDLKSLNILIRKGLCMISDFGLSKVSFPG